MKKNYIMPTVVVYRLDRREIFTTQSGEVEVILTDNWYE